MSRVYSSMGENTAEITEKFEKLSQDLNGVLIPGGSIPFEELQNQEKRMGYTYNITNKFVTDDTFREGAGHRYGAGANVYWTKDGNWDILAPVMVTGVKGDAEEEFRVGEVNISKENIGLENASMLPAVDTQGLLTLADDESPTTQKLLDEIADRVANILVTRSMMSNVDVDDTEKIPTSALVHALLEAKLTVEEHRTFDSEDEAMEFLDSMSSDSKALISKVISFTLTTPGSLIFTSRRVYWVYCYLTSDDYGIQIALTYNTNGNMPIVFTRSKWNNVWGNFLNNAQSLQSQITANTDAIETLNSEGPKMVELWRGTAKKNDIITVPGISKYSIIIAQIGAYLYPGSLSSTKVQFKAGGVYAGRDIQNSEGFYVQIYCANGAINNDQVTLWSCFWTYVGDIRENDTTLNAIYGLAR